MNSQAFLTGGEPGQFCWLRPILLRALVAFSRMNALGQAQRGENPLEGWSPRLPENGHILTPCSEAYTEYERRGLQEAAGLGFVRKNPAAVEVGPPPPPFPRR